jgi:hypothetical protein
MYRVCWKTESNSGNGEYMPYETAKSWSDGMNERHKEKIFHWIEPRMKRLLTWTTDALNNALR